MADNRTNIIITADDKASGALAKIGSALSGLTGAGAAANAALASLSAGAALAGLSAVAKNAIDAADNLNDLSQRTGVAIKDLAAYKLAAEQSGSSLEGVAKGMKAVATAMLDNSDALQAAGITAKTTEGAMRQLAELFSQLPGGAEKSAIATKLFGKAGQELIPLLNLGAQGLDESAAASARYGSAMKALAPAADAFNDNLTLISINSQALGAELANQVAPAMLVVSQAMADASASSITLSSSGAVLRTMFETVAVLGVNVAYVFNAVGTEIGGIAAQIVALGKLDFKGFAAIGEAMREDAERARKEVDALSERILNPPKMPAPDKKSLPSDDVLVRWKALVEEMKKAGDGARKAKAPVDELAVVLNKLRARDTGVDSSFAADFGTLQKALVAGKISVDDYTEAVGLLVGQQKVIKDQLAEVAKAEEDWQKAVEKSRETVEQSIVGLQDRAAAAEAELANYGLTRSEIEQTIIARLEEQRAMAAGFDSQAELVANLEKEIDARKRARDAMQGIESKDAAKKALEESAKAWENFSRDIEQSLTDSLMRAFENGDNFGEAFVKSLQNTLKTAVLKVAVQAIVSPITNALGGGSGAGDSLWSSIGNANTVWSGATAAGSLISGAGSLFGSSSISAFGSGMSMTAAEAAAASSAYTGAGMASTGSAISAGSSVGSAMPYVAAAIAAYKIAESMGVFGTAGTPHTGGMASYSAASGLMMGRDASNLTYDFNLNNFDQNLNNSAANLAKGLTTMLDTTAKAFGKASGFAVGTGFADDSSKDGAWGALQISRAGQATVDWKRGQDNWPGREFADGAEGQAQYQKALAESVRSVIDQMNLPAWATAMLDQLGSNPSLENLTAKMDEITGLAASLEGVGNIFDTESQKLAKAFDKLGLTLPTTESGYIELAKAQDLTTEAGRNAYVALMQLAPAWQSAQEGANALSKSITEALSKDSLQLSIDLLRAQGDTAGATKLITQGYTEQQRAAYIANEATRALIKSIEDEAEAAKKSTELRASLASKYATITPEDAAKQIRAAGFGSFDLSAALKMSANELRGAAAAAIAAASDGALEGLEKLGPAFDAIATAAEAAADKAKAIADERVSIETELFTLQGNTTKLRARELEALDPTNRALKEQVYALEDAKDAHEAYQKAVDEVAKALGDVKSARNAVESVQEQATNAYLSALQDVEDAQERIANIQLDAQIELAKAANDAAREMADLGKQLRDYVEEAKSPSNNFARLLTKALAGDQDAMKALPTATGKSIEAARDSSVTAIDFARSRAAILAQVASVATLAELAGKNTMAEPKGEDELAKAQAELAAAQNELADVLKVANAINAPLSTSINDLVGKYQLAAADLAAATAALEKSQAALDAIKDNTGVTALLAEGIKTAILVAVVDKFAQLDTTLDGLLSFDEFKTGFIGLASESTLKSLFELTDTNGDGFISAIEAADASIKAIVPLFDKLDTSMDGLLSFDEYKTAFEGLATDAQLKAGFDTLDTNNDGLLSKLEAIDLGISTTLVDKFDTLDKTLDGALSFAEFKTAFAGLATDTQLKAVFDILDVNGNGTLDKLEAIRVASETTANKELSVTVTAPSGGSMPVFAADDPLRSVFAAIAAGTRWMNSVAAGLTFNNPALDSMAGTYAQANSDFTGTYTLTKDSRDYLAEIVGYAKRIEVNTGSAYYELLNLGSRSIGTDGGIQVRFDRGTATGTSGGPVFASGAAFRNGIVTRPTGFDIGTMGEAGPEGILPLANIGGRLGVYANGGSNDKVMLALLAEIRQLRAEAAATARATYKTSQSLDSVITGGESVKTEAWVP